jgi:hypothetical protein
LISFRVFQSGTLLRGCGVSTPGSGTVSKTVSKRPREHPLDGLEGRSGRVRTDDTNWTGAEIKSCCRLASLLDVPLVQAAQNVVPVAVTAGDKIEGLRQWASGRCLSADRGGVFADGRWQWRTGEESRAGAGCELSTRENTEGSRLMMVTCSPRVGIRLASLRQARLRRRHICQPPQAIPASPITHVYGSGTGTGLARRKP